MSKEAMSIFEGLGTDFSVSLTLLDAVEEALYDGHSEPLRLFICLRIGRSVMVLFNP